MKIVSRLQILALLLLLLTSASAQPPAAAKPGGSPAPVRERERFASLEAGFTIDLPDSISGYGKVKAVPGVSKGGSSFSFRGPERLFNLGYDDLLSGQDPQKAVIAAADGFASASTARGDKLVYNNAGTFGGLPGRELHFVLPSNTNLLIRYLSAKDRVYVLLASWAADNDGAYEKKVLDSFRLIDAAGIIAKKLKEATPEPLPQLPATKRVISDAEQAGLRGRVRSVSTTEESPEGSESAAKTLLRGAVEYDLAGIC